MKNTFNQRKVLLFIVEGYTDKQSLGLPFYLHIIKICRGYVSVLVSHSASLYTIFHTCQDFDSFVRAYNHEYDMLNLLHTGNMLGTLMHGPYSIAQCMGLD